MPLRRSFSVDTLRPSVHTHEDLRAPDVLPSKMYSDFVKDAFYPAKLLKMQHSRSYTDLNLAWRSYPSQPRGELGASFLRHPYAWRDRLDETLESAERVMADVHKSLYPSKHYIHLNEYTWFDWERGAPAFMVRPWERAYLPPSYSRCWDWRKWSNCYGRTFSQPAYDRWRRFAGNRTVGDYWQNPGFWMHRFSHEGIFTPYHKSPLYYTPLHRYYDYVQY